MSSVNKYPELIGPANIFQSECSQIVENIRKCILSNQTATFSFKEKRQPFLLLNIHCEPEVHALSKELTSKNTRFDYKIVYNTQQPYHIHYDKKHDRVSITQHTFL